MRWRSWALGLFCLSLVACGGGGGGTPESNNPGNNSVPGGGSQPTPPALAVTSFSPTQGIVGTMVSLNGTGFTGASAVRISDTMANFHLVSASRIDVEIPEGADSGPFTITTPTGETRSKDSFTVLSSPPTLASFSPGQGAPGTEVVIIGTHLSGTSRVEFGNVIGSELQLVSDNEVHVKVPESAASGPLTLVAPGGSVASSTRFIVLPPPPTLSRFSPTSGTAGTQVHLYGEHLSPPESVYLNDQSLADVQVINDGELIVTIPQNAASGHFSLITPGGRSMLSDNFIVLAPPPSLLSFNPTSGTPGTVVRLQGSHLTGVIGLKLGNLPLDAYQILNDNELSLTIPEGASSGMFQVMTAGGSAATTASFTVQDFIPILSGFSPTEGKTGTAVRLSGSHLSGATEVRLGNLKLSSFRVLSDSELSFTIPDNGSSGRIKVTTPGGSATTNTRFTVTPTATLDLRIDGVEVIQSTQTYPSASVPLVANRSAWVRVFAVANEISGAKPKVRVEFKQGNNRHSLSIDAPAGGLATSVNTRAVTNSWDAAVPAAWLVPGTTLSATVDPDNQVAESDETNNSLEQSLDVRSAPAWKLSFIPIQTGDGNLGEVENANHDRNDLVDVARRLHPLPDAIDIAVGPTFVSSVASVGSDGSDWGTVLGELNAKRQADGASDRYYYGVLKVSYGGGTAGMGYVGGKTAIGWDQYSAAGILAHEVGHNFGRPHAPCGGAGNPDSSYPTTGDYAGGHIGVDGWDVFADNDNLKIASDYTDVMGYCGNQWISDYNYRKEMDYRASHDTLTGVAPAHKLSSATNRQGLLIWGHVQSGTLTLEPAFVVKAGAKTVDAGDYRVELLAEDGTRLAATHFTPEIIADGPDERADFALNLALDDRQLAALKRIAIWRGTALLASRDAGAPSFVRGSLKPRAALRLRTLAGNHQELRWDAVQAPVLMLRDPVSGDVRGFLRGGQARLPPALVGLTILGSDGLRSEVLVAGASPD